jgi:hypothetical protein
MQSRKNCPFTSIITLDFDFFNHCEDMASDRLERLFVHSVRRITVSVECNWCWDHEVPWDVADLAEEEQFDMACLEHLTQVVVTDVELMIFVWLKPKLRSAAPVTPVDACRTVLEALIPRICFLQRAGSKVSISFEPSDNAWDNDQVDDTLPYTSDWDDDEDVRANHLYAQQDFDLIITPDVLTPKNMEFSIEACMPKFIEVG